jgi:predicted nuclease with TOPRIM domain
MEEMKWLKDLIAEAEAWTKCGLEPDDPVVKDEKVVGEVPENLRKFRSYYLHLGDRIKELAVEHEKVHEDTVHNPETCKKISEEISEIKENIDLLRTIFWKSLRACLGISADFIALRKGWKVVELIGDPEPRVIRAITIIG